MNPQQLTDLPARGILEDRLDRAIEVVHSRLVIGPGLDGDIAIPAPSANPRSSLRQKR